jgi:hypothetical protein
VQFPWIPAHVEVPGNGTADRAAKEAAGEPPSQPDSLQTLMATRVSISRRTMRSEGETSWKAWGTQVCAETVEEGGRVIRRLEDEYAEKT